MNISAYRELSAHLLAFATNDGKGRSELDAIYQWIVEGRDGPTAKDRARYSSCADLAHWLYFRLGVRAPWLNREELTAAPRDFRYGVNLNRFIPPPFGPNDCAECPIEIPDMLPGDVYVVDTSAGGHVICVQAGSPSGHDVTTAEYGAPGGARREHSLTKRSGLPKSAVYSDGKRLLSYLPLERVLATHPPAAAPDVRCLATWLSADTLDALEAQF